MEINAQGEVVLTGSPERRKSSGVFWLLITPLSKDGKPSDEPLAKANIDTAAGLIAAVYGKAALFQRLYENAYDLAKDQVSAVSPTFENPNWFDQVDFHTQPPEILQGMAQTISKRDEPDRNRIALALRWFKQGVSEMDGVDSVIKFWVAIETLAMPDDTSVRRANHKLAHAYGMTPETAAKRFGLGRLHGFRSDIVHNGRVPPVDGMLQKYLEALFIDLLAAEIGHPSLRRAEAVLTGTGFKLGDYL
jgi:hypothetical protein